MKHREIFYAPPENISPNRLQITGDELVHLSRVVRKKVRDVIEVVDGQGNLYTAVITQITGHIAAAEIQKRSRFVGEPNFQLTLAQAIPKSNRFDWVIEKGTEIGVVNFIPLLTEFSIAEATAHRQRRWQKIAIAAMKQCGRSMLPRIFPAQSLQEVIQKRDMLTIGLVAENRTGAKNLSALALSLKSQLTQYKSAIIIIGPEGGLSSEELEMTRNNGFHCFTLGPRRLRSETAGIVSAAIWLELLGELG